MHSFQPFSCNSVLPASKSPSHRPLSFSSHPLPRAATFNNNDNWLSPPVSVSFHCNDKDKGETNERAGNLRTVQTWQRRRVVLFRPRVFHSQSASVRRLPVQGGSPEQKTVKRQVTHPRNSSTGTGIPVSPASCPVSSVSKKPHKPIFPVLKLTKIESADFEAGPEDTAEDVLSFIRARKGAGKGGKTYSGGLDWGATVWEQDKGSYFDATAVALTSTKTVMRRRGHKKGVPERLCKYA